ncbi:MAG: FAD-binding protein [Oscillospiraceae bacterium]
MERHHLHHSGCDVAALHGLANGNVITILTDAAKANGVEIVTDTRANELIVENGKVVGVKATTSEGANVTLHANSGVVLTGGFSANAPMVVEYNNYWPGLSDTMPSTNAPTITGDGIVMAKAVGADLVGIGLCPADALFPSGGRLPVQRHLGQRRNAGLRQ